MSKPITPKRSARELNEDQAVKQATREELGNLSPQQYDTLAECRKIAQQHLDTGAQVINHNRPETVAAAVAITMAGSLGGPVPEIEHQDQYEPEPIAAKEEPTPYVMRQSVKINLRDGRQVSLRPPGGEAVLLRPQWLKGKEWTNAEVALNLAECQLMLFVTKIDNHSIKQPLRTWDEVAQVVHELGYLGHEDVEDAVSHYWPAGGARLWSEAKN